MAANRFASGSVSGYIPPTSYEVMEEVYDESYEPTQEGQYQKERDRERESGACCRGLPRATGKQNGVP